MDGLLQHFEAAQRVPAGRERCGCCDGSGEHAFGGSECRRCDASGTVRKGCREPYCDDSENRPPRRPWRKSAAGPADYGIGHRPLRDGAPAHDLQEGYSGDIYTHPQYWAAHNPLERSDKEGLAQLRRVRGKPDAPVDIYRASHRSAPHEINHGDWVSLSRTYAGQHACAESGSDDPDAQYQVHHARVPAKHVRDAGTDQYREQGYWGPDIKCCGHEKTAAGVGDYGMQMRPDEEGDPLHDMGSRDWPKDIYDRVHEYDDSQGEYGYEHLNALRRTRGNPEKRVRIYRGAPARNPESRNAKRGEINHGDWVTLNKSYAEQEARSVNETSAANWKGPNHPERYHIWSTVVPAKHVRSAGNSLMEWGYWGEDKKDLTHISEQCSHWNPFAKRGADDRAEQRRQHRLNEGRHLAARQGAAAHYGDGPRTAAFAQPAATLDGAYLSVTAARIRTPPSGMDWEENLRFLRHRKRNEPLMHRGLAVELPPEVHSFVHDHFQDRDRQARAIAEHLQSRPLGMHWSAGEQVPRHFADWERKKNTDSTKVILHAALPEVEHIETDPEKLNEGGVFRYGGPGGSEHEIPMKAGAPVRIKGISWYGYGNRKRSGELHDHVHTASRAALAEHPEYGPKPEYEPAPEGISDDERIEHGDRQRKIGNEWKFHIRRGLSLGHLDYAKAHELGYWASGHDSHDRYADHPTGWQKLPHDLYHVTTDAPGVRQHGLLNQHERGVNQGAGLGSSEDDTISLTSSPDVAHGIHRALHEYHHFLNHGDPADLIERARKGDGGSRPFHRDLIKGFDSRWEEGKPLPRHLDALIRGKEDKYETLGHSRDEMPGWEPSKHPDNYSWMTAHTPPREFYTHFERDADPREHLYRKSQFYKAFSAHREHAGGHYDPNFMSNDVHSFAKMDPSHFALLHVHPKPGAQGYYLPGESEWRTTAGDALHVHRVEHAGEMHHEAAGVSHWQHRDCGVYAKALTEADPGLRIGAVAGPHSDPAEGHALHWFAHNDTHAYDSLGRHKLPYVNVWDSAFRNYFPPESHKSMGFKQVLDVPAHHFGDLSDDEHRMLPAAHRHIREHGILTPPDQHTAAAGHLVNPHTGGNEWFHEAAYWSPTERIFGPTHCLDKRLFTDGKLKPEVREAVLERLDTALRVDGGVAGSDWQEWITVYLAGSEASLWTSEDCTGNSDFDTLLEVDFDVCRGYGNSDESQRADEEIQRDINRALQRHYNDEHWHPPFDPGGTWSLTGYVNIRPLADSRPYAAWNISDSRWLQEPPDLPDWGPEHFPQGKALWQQARALAGEVRAILRLPEPFRTQEASRIWDYIHQGRSKAFSIEGEGWTDAANVLEKYLDQAPGNLIGKLKSLKYGPPDHAPMALAHGMTTAAIPSGAGPR